MSLRRVGLRYRVLRSLRIVLGSRFLLLQKVSSLIYREAEDIDAGGVIGFSEVKTIQFKFEGTTEGLKEWQKWLDGMPVPKLKGKK
jgi:hypothetical protein